MKEKAGAVSTSINNLGIDYTGGRSIAGNRPVRVKRWKAFKLRLKRQKRVAKILGKKASFVVEGGMIPGLTYGACVHGVSRTELHCMQVALTRADGRSQAGTHHAKAFLLNSPRVVKVWLAPLKAWAEHVWLAAVHGPHEGRLSLADLARGSATRSGVRCQP